MYQELIRYPDASRLETVLSIVRIVLGVFLMSILSWVLRTLAVPAGDLFAFLVLVVWAFMIYSRRIVEYRYSLMDTELIVARKVGKRETTVFSLEIIDIVRIGTVEKKSRLKTARYILPTRKLRSVQIVYSVDGAERRVILQPSDHLLQLIRMRAAFKEPKRSAE